MLNSIGRVIKRNISKEALRAHIILLSRFYIRFGLWNGVKLFLKFKLRRVDRIQLPGFRFPFSLRTGTSDIQAFNHIFLDDNYYFRYAEKPKIIIDAGANIGLFTIKMKNEYPEATIICIEPDQDNFQRLTANLSMYDNIYLENCALWGTNTSGTIHNKFYLGNWGMVVEENLGEGRIPFVTISSLLQKYKVDQVDILKLDIETSEKQVFAGQTNVWLPKVRVMIIELHDWLETGCASVFFKTINSNLTDYTYLVKGEYTVIINTKK